MTVQDLLDELNTYPSDSIIMVDCPDEWGCPVHVESVVLGMDNHTVFLNLSMNGT